MMYWLAHRGYHATLPENTLAAFAAAVALGVDGIETDVRLTADGKPAIMHDRIVGGRAVSELTHGELERAAGHPVPVLEEILEAFPDVLWNIEIKTPETWPQAVSVLRRYQNTRRLLVTSFRHDVVVRCAAELEIECGLLIADRPVAMATFIEGCANYPLIKNVVWDYNIIDPLMLEQVTAAGWSNYAYGAITSAEHRHAGTLKLAGLITDHPLYKEQG